MKISFTSLPIVVTTELSGPSGRTEVRLALDTGAGITVLDPRHLKLIGHDPGSSSESITLTTADANLKVPLVSLLSITAFGIERSGLRVAAHPLPRDATVDGLLGMDFLEDLIVILNFKKKWIDVRRSSE